jgi:arylamine N-acetyltransferase
VSARTHLVVEVVLDGERLLCDPGFGLSILRPIALRDGHEENQDGRRFRVSRAADGGLPAWQLARLRGGSWEVQHTTDELAVHPSDVEAGHHYTSTSPDSHFTTGLVVVRQLDGRHVTLTSSSVTIRRAGQPAEHHDLAPGDLAEWLDVLDPHLTPAETTRLLTLLSRTTSPRNAA